ncbi:MAG: bifunctional methylenetetrahydrofolate dehydrogenase/methenyltetrahydrofolate cyclohydrolase FolD [Gammaproteobacteria bacterium]|jgi:methylenetetrahydrofolate dehydrogenase (NADP+)/methenyltetrahydrofolate cyclohydrolase|nr:MAG: bifunctional methylenetetrahydrofolate dehydrogenase/methenyltetrahydrofolate cyclohydrolase FolD [Gammaproteobacteria bacterium]
MAATIIDGKAISTATREKLKQQVTDLGTKGIRPGLAVIIVGEDPASQVYVRNKVKACVDTGIYSEKHEIPATTTEEDLLKLIHRLNDKKDIHGILVQLPLPKHINSDRVLETISETKDVDGFHLYNVGALVTGNTIFAPCTPFGVKVMIEHLGLPVEGKSAVVVGRSNIVGKPMAIMLLEMNATVSICTSRTKDLKAYTKMADILVVAVGRPNLITADMVKPGAAVFDVGMNRLADGKLAGDVDYDGVKEIAGYITPVPGGVGPMTITMLLANTVIAAERAHKLK